ncbi:MAG: chemotaxis protein CheA, partial [Mizugakiibacter sp.]|uniref:chemotaxis protein CheA n=1 Tax=Mizugakiibacter sp. TaxID=1972610 RepID=UPI00320D922F
ESGSDHAPAAAPPPAAAEVPAAAPAEAAPPAAAKQAAAAETTVRVDTARLDALVNFIGELVLVRNRIANLAARSEDSPLERAVGELDRVTNDLQTAVMRTRMQPVGRLFQRFPRIARDLARQLGKQVQLELEGEDTQLDRNLVEALADPLVHLVRNALDHGIEPPDARAGKPAAGRVRLAASQEGEHIVITIADDGRGMDPAVLKRKAIEKGVLSAERAERMADEECYELIFLPGFSTRSEISDISGRGVGMDVVKTRVAELGGTIAIRSQVGRGSEIKVSVPLTLAILRALMVRVAGRMLALPLANVSEVFELDASRVRTVDGREVVAHRARPLPLSRLDRWLGADANAADAGAREHVAVVHIGHQRVGCVVHEVVGREEVVIKPLGALLRQVPGIAGATITGDGRIALIVDLVALLRAAPMERVA